MASREERKEAPNRVIHQARWICLLVCFFLPFFRTNLIGEVKPITSACMTAMHACTMGDKEPVANIPGGKELFCELSNACVQFKVVSPLQVMGGFATTLINMFKIGNSPPAPVAGAYNAVQIQHVYEYGAWAIVTIGCMFGSVWITRIGLLFFTVSVLFLSLPCHYSDLQIGYLVAMAACFIPI